MIVREKFWLDAEEPAILPAKRQGEQATHMQTKSWIAAILCAVTPLAAVADDFTFKRVKVGGLPGKRITVQIDPEEQARFLAALPKVDPNPVHAPEEPKVADEATGKPGPAPASSYAWYWDKVPTDLGASADRFDIALASLSDGPDGTIVGAPRLQHRQQVLGLLGHRHHHPMQVIDTHRGHRARRQRRRRDLGETVGVDPEHHLGQQVLEAVLERWLGVPS